MEHYPKWVYHRVEAPRVVNDPDEWGALGPGWTESPAFPAPEPFETQPEPTPEAEPVKGRRR